MFAPLSWVRPSEDLRNSSSYCLGAFAAIQAFASERNAASCGVSSKFIFVLSLRFVLARQLRGVAFAHAIDQRVLPIRQAAERQRHRIGTPVIQMTIELPGETHATMHLDVVFRAMLERLRGADARGGGGLGQFRGIGRERPGAIVEI